MYKYKLSKDYEKLYELICNSEKIICFIDYRWSDNDAEKPMRDICLCRRRKNFDISIGVRGIEYTHVANYDKGKGLSEKEIFIKRCEKNNLEWVIP